MNKVTKILMVAIFSFPMTILVLGLMYGFREKPQHSQIAQAEEVNWLGSTGVVVSVEKRSGDLAAVVIDYMGSETTWRVADTFHCVVGNRVKIGTKSWRDNGGHGLPPSASKWQVIVEPAQ